MNVYFSTTLIIFLSLTNVAERLSTKHNCDCQGKKQTMSDVFNEAVTDSIRFWNW